MNFISMIKKIWGNLNSQATAKTLGSLGVIAMIAIVVTFNWAFELSGLAMIVAAATIGLSIFWLFDKLAVPEINTMTLLKKDANAYSRFLLAVAIIIAAAILAG